jgi:hypothetical protein
MLMLGAQVLGDKAYGSTNTTGAMWAGRNMIHMHAVLHKRNLCEEKDDNDAAICSTSSVAAGMRLPRGKGHTCMMNQETAESTASPQRYEYLYLCLTHWTLQSTAIY